MNSQQFSKIEIPNRQTPQQLSPQLQTNLHKLNERHQQQEFVRQQAQLQNQQQQAVNEAQHKRILQEKQSQNFPKAAQHVANMSKPHLIQVAPSLNFKSNSEEVIIRSHTPFINAKTTANQKNVQTFKEQQTLFKQQGNFQLQKQTFPQKAQQQQLATRISQLSRQQGSLKISTQQKVSTSFHKQFNQSQQNFINTFREKQNLPSQISTTQVPHLFTKQSIVKPAFQVQSNQKQQTKPVIPLITNPLPLQAQLTNSLKVVASELKQNIVESSPMSPEQKTLSQQQITTHNKAQPPGQMPPNNSVIEQLNNAENFMEVVQRLKLKRVLRGRRRRRQMAEFRFFAHV